MNENKVKIYDIIYFLLGGMVLKSRKCVCTKYFVEGLSLARMEMCSVLCHQTSHIISPLEFHQILDIVDSPTLAPGPPIWDYLVHHKSNL